MKSTKEKNLAWREYWVQHHNLGDKLPRGKAFDKSRWREKISGSNYDIKKMLVGSIREALSQSLTSSKPFHEHEKGVLQEPLIVSFDEFEEWTVT